MPRDLQADIQMLNTVLGLAQNREIGRAAAIAQEALRSGFEHPLLLNIMATQLEEKGQYAEALRLLERAVEIAPEDLPARNALALCLQRVDRPADALRHTDILIRQKPDLSFAHASRGNALIALGSLGLARESHLRAISLDPNSIVSMAALASIASHRGEHVEARMWAERTLAHVPGYPEAVLSLAAADAAEGKPQDAERLIRGLLEDPRAGATDKARAQGQLGDILDTLGRPDDAMAAYRACNDSLAVLHRKYATERSACDYALALARAFGQVAGDWTPRPASAPGVPLQHVFVIGFPRSGTTLLEVVLDGHPDVVSLEEHELLTEAVLRYQREPLDLRPLMDAPEPELEELRRNYWAQVAQAGANVTGKVFIDKHPLNTLKLPLIARLFPDAKILFACRDPRDVVLSCFRRRFKMNAAMYQMLTLDGAARFYDAVMAFADLARPTLGLAWRQVSYEQVIADFSGEMRSICEFIGLGWSESMGLFAERVKSREHSTPSTAQLTRGLDRSGVGHWRRYASHLAGIEPILKRWVDRFAAPTAH